MALTAARTEQGSVTSAGRAPGAVAGKLAETEHHRIADRVINEVSGTLAAHQAGLAQGLQVFGGVGLAGLERGGDFADGAAAGLEEMQDAEAGGIAEQAEPFRSEFNLLALGRRVHGEPFAPGVLLPANILLDNIAIYKYSVKRKMRCGMLLVLRSAARIAALLAIAAALAPPARAQQPLSLGSAVRIALEHNPELRAAGEDDRAAAARAAASRAAWFPRLDFSQGFTRSDNPVYVFGTLLTQRRFSMADFGLTSLNTPHPLDNFDTRFSANMTLFDSGRTWQRTRAAERLKSAADYELEQARQDLILRVVQAYFGAVVAQEDLVAARDALKTAESSRERIAAFEHAGQVVTSDLLSAQVFEAQARDREIRAENAVEVARLAIARELGVEPAALGEPASGLGGPAEISGTIEEWENEALAARPLLRAVQLQVEAARKGEKLARAEFGPTVGLFSEFERDALALGNSSGTNWTAGVRLNWNIFAGGADRYRAAEAAAGRRKAEDQLEWARSGVRLELRRAYLESHAATARAMAAHQSADQARESLRIIENRYQAGLVTITELLRAQQAVVEARTGYVAAVGDWYAARASLERAAGRLTADSPFVLAGEKP